MSAGGVSRNCLLVLAQGSGSTRHGMQCTWTRQGQHLASWSCCRLHQHGLMLGWERLHARHEAVLSVG